MNPASESASSPGLFLTTRWSVVLAAQGATSSAGDALASLCQVYWYPLYAFVRRQGHSAHDAQDLTQEFFARLLEKEWLAGVAQERGRFRSWLLASMKHFLAKEWTRSQTIKRGGRTKIVSFDEATAEMLYSQEPADLATPEKLYDRRWALTLLDRARQRLREECTFAGKLAHFIALEGTLTGENAPYSEIAVRLGTTEGAVKVAIHRFRARFRELLRAELAETVEGEGEIDAELRELLAVLGG